MDRHELFMSCRKGDLEKLTYLVEQREVDLNVRDQWDSTPLYYACLCGHSDLVSYLLENGAKCEANTFDGERCLYGALTREIKKLLKSYNMVSSRTMRRDVFDEFLRRLLEDGFHSDITFVVHGERFPVHRSILSVRSDYFHEMFKTKWMDRSEIHLNNSQIIPSAFFTILQYLYTGRYEVNVKDVDNSRRLIKQCRLHNLAQRVEDEMKKIVSFQESKLGVEVSMLSTEAETDRLKAEFYTVARMTFDLTSENLFYPDICFMVEGQKILCHKAFFCGRSDYFKVLLLDHFGEVESEDSVPIIHLHGIKLDVFTPILYYVYTDSGQISKENVYEVLSMADLYLLPGLKRQCAGVIRQYLDTENVVSVLRTARIYNVPRLQDHCAQFMAEALEEMLTREDFEDLVNEDAATVHKREEADTIDIIDEIRFHITNFLQTFSDVEEANEKLVLIDNFLEKLDLEG